MVYKLVQVSHGGATSPHTQTPPQPLHDYLGFPLQALKGGRV